MTVYTVPPDQHNLVLHPGDRLFVGLSEHGRVDNTTMNGGIANIYALGSAVHTTINSRGIVNDGGTDDETTINAGGVENVGWLPPLGSYLLGTSEGTLINSGGVQNVGGGTATDTTINGGVENVMSSGTADNVIFGHGAKLHLDKPSGLTGTITNWQVGDVIDFLKTDVTGVNVTGNTLTVTYAGTQTASYTLSGQQANTEFQLAPDGKGSTDLSLKVKDITGSSSANLLSLAGGGIKAMTSDAALFAGLLEYFSNEGAPTTIANLLSKESAVSANSGSSWFTDLLAYSQSFDNSLQNYSAFFSQSGYMGQLETAYYNYATAPNTNIDRVIVSILNAVGNKAGVNLAQLYGLLANSSFNWNDFLSKVIFEPDNAAQLLQSVNFYSDQSLRTDALPDQSLIYESSISSNEAAINKYSSLLGVTNNETVSTISNAGTDTSGNTYSYIPAVITSLGSKTDISAPALPSISTGSLDATYSTYNTTFGSHSATTVLPNFNLDGLSAFLAASASSAAASAAASGGVYNTGSVGNITKHIPSSLLSALLNETQDLSSLVQVNNANGSSTASDPTSGILDGYTTPASLVTQGNSLLRLADGGYIDNTSVTAGLTYLQANNDINNFTDTALTFFDGVDPNLGKINPGYNNIGEEAELLFTGSNQNQRHNVGHPSAAVFDSAQTTGLDEPIWEYIGSNGFKLEDFQLGVTTAPNDMGIAAGEHGTLNLWVVTTKAGALPSLNQASWSQYSDLYDQMIAGLQTSDNGHIGADLLANSLGLGNPTPAPFQGATSLLPATSGDPMLVSHA